jgi:glycosyltransferase involved in cell wall biosynthesis
LKIILTVHQFLPDFFSGTEILTYQVAKELKRLGHEVIVITGWTSSQPSVDLPLSDTYEYDGIRVERFYQDHMHRGNQANTKELEYNNPLFGTYFRKILLREKPDVVHFFHLFRLSASAVDVCEELSIRMVLTPTDFWFICPTLNLRLPDNRVCHGPDKDGLNCLRHITSIQNTSKARRLVNYLPDWLLRGFIHLIDRGYNFDAHYSLLTRALIHRREFLLRRMNVIDKVMVPTNIMMSKLTDNGLNKAHAIKVPYGLNFSHLENSRRPDPQEILRLGYIGTLSEHKGVHILLNAMRNLAEKPVQLKIYGNLDDHPEYAGTLLEMAGMDDRVEFCGTFPNDQIGLVFSELDVLVVPSIWHENAPLVVYSAQAAGCPVIASDMEGLSEIIEHKKNGLLFEAGNVADLESVIQLLLDNRALILELSNNARRPLSIREYGNHLSEVYNELYIARESS